jgi:hypothetical protein
VWDGGLQGIQAVIERQQRMLAEGDDNSLISRDRTVERVCFGPVGWSAVVLRLRHLATVLGLMR